MYRQQNNFPAVIAMLYYINNKQVISKGLLTMAKPQIKISVRNMVEFLLRSGDIDLSGGYSGSQILQQGTKIHRMLQREAGENYKPEVRLSYETEFDDFILVVNGIADGIITTEDSIIIDEIKSISTPLEILNENYNTLHWAQAKCYAWMYLVQSDVNVSKIIVRLTYYEVDTEEIKQLQQTFNHEELKEFFHSLTAQYARWAEFVLQHRLKRDKAIKSLSFPFAEYRKGQRELAVAVYKTIRDKKLLFAQAPTGTGKTISTLFPAVKAMGEAIGEKIFYLTAKTVTRQVAEDTIQIMINHGLVFKSITLTAKEKICFCESTICDPRECTYACGHYDRVNEAIMDILVNESMITRDTVEKYAKKHQVCPFEYGLDISLWVDCVICDYNYVFDPRAYLRRFFEYGGDYIFLIDEAHNLVDRARDMYSAELSKQAFMKNKQTLKQLVPKAYREFVKINKLFVEMRKGIEEKYGTVTIEKPSDLYKHVEKFVEAFDDYLAKNRQTKIDEGLLNLFFNCKAFITIYNLYDERYVTYITRGDDEVKLKLFCIDPSFLIRKACDKGRSAIFFSGTLQPLLFYKDTLGGNDEDRIIYLASPFPPDNLCLMIAGNISTRYKDRQDSYEIIARYIKKAVEFKTGNYLIFFPSFEYMRNVYEQYNQLWPEDYTILQDSHMNDDEREAFLSSFEENPERSLIAFAVMGGIFSEGIDLTGDRLSGAIIIGVGLPQLSPERDLIARYYNQTKRLGFEYAYMFPGMNKVLQASGRVIRTEKDRGFVLLLDDRFLHKRYLNLFPIEWNGYIKVRSPEDVSNTIADFWSRQ